MSGCLDQELNEVEKTLCAASAAKILCSAIFISNRDAKEAFQNSVLSTPLTVRGRALPQDAYTKIDVDWDDKSVRVTVFDSPPRAAKFYGDQGCIILPYDANDVFFEPVELSSSLPDPMDQAWPMGDVLPSVSLPSEVDEAKLKGAVDAAFVPEAYTVAFLVVYKGQLIAERYSLGVTKDTLLESWSMGKSITATLIGVLIREGHFGIEDPAPVPEWQRQGDPRSKIRIADLLRMSSGLRFSSPGDPPHTLKQGVSDHMYVYSGAIDVFQYSINSRLEFPPNTVGRYRNCDPLTLGYIIKRTIRESGEEYLSWPQRALFDRIGVRRQVLETDPYGNFIMSGFDYGTPRNWARLGLLYQQDGVWEGKRILPVGFAEFVGTPALAWEEPIYGGLFWVNGRGDLKLPRDAFHMEGYGGQSVIIDPSHELVVVRMGHTRGGSYPVEVFNEALLKLINAIENG